MADTAANETEYQEGGDDLYLVMSEGKENKAKVEKLQKTLDYMLNKRWRAFIFTSPLIGFNPLGLDMEAYRIMRKLYVMLGEEAFVLFDKFYKDNFDENIVFDHSKILKHWGSFAIGSLMAIQNLSKDDMALKRMGLTAEQVKATLPGLKRLVNRQLQAMKDERRVNAVKRDVVDVRGLNSMLDITDELKDTLTSVNAEGESTENNEFKKKTEEIDNIKPVISHQEIVYETGVAEPVSAHKARVRFWKKPVWFFGATVGIFVTLFQGVSVVTGVIGTLLFLAATFSVTVPMWATLAISLAMIGFVSYTNWPLFHGANIKLTESLFIKRNFFKGLNTPVQKAWAVFYLGVAFTGALGYGALAWVGGIALYSLLTTMFALTVPAWGTLALGIGLGIMCILTVYSFTTFMGKLFVRNYVVDKGDPKPGLLDDIRQYLKEHFSVTGGFTLKNVIKVGFAMLSLTVGLVLTGAATVGIVLASFYAIAAIGGIAAAFVVAGLGMVMANIILNFKSMIPLVDKGIMKAAGFVFGFEYGPAANKAVAPEYDKVEALLNESDMNGEDTKNETAQEAHGLPEYPWYERLYRHIRNPFRFANATYTSVKTPAVYGSLGINGSGNAALTAFGIIQAAGSVLNAAFTFASGMLCSIAICFMGAKEDMAAMTPYMGDAGAAGFKDIFTGTEGVEGVQGTEAEAENYTPPSPAP